MKKFYLAGFILLAAGILMYSCKKSDSPTNSTSSSSGSFIGNWKIVTSNGVDVSSAGGTFDITTAQITESWQVYTCSKVYTYTTSGNNYTTTLQTTTCNQGSDPSNVPGYKASGTYSVSGSKLTLDSGGNVTICERIN